MTPLWILVPSYEPNHRLLDLVADLRRQLPQAGVVVVDDGSGAAYAPVFDAVARHGATVLHHSVNAGKAAAVRTGLAWVHERDVGADVVCADSDGQHRPADIAAIAAALRAQRAAGTTSLVLGVRGFDGEVPLRSRFGNTAMTAMVTLATGRRISDTQTGLRGCPAELLPWLQGVPGERFAWELAVLLAAGREGVAIQEVPTQTVYLDHNASSHFRPVVDSVRVLAPLLLFTASSLLAAVVDTVGVLVLAALTGNLPLAVAGSRLASATLNFTVNRRAVFSARGPVHSQLVRYLALAVVLLAASYGSISLLVTAGLPLLAAKFLTDAILWAASYLVQREHVFPRQGQGAVSTESTTSDAAENGRRSQVPSLSSSVRPASRTSDSRAR